MNASSINGCVYVSPEVWVMVLLAKSMKDWLWVYQVNQVHCKWQSRSVYTQFQIGQLAAQIKDHFTQIYV